MPKICYVPKKFTDKHLKIIGMANAILKKYADQNIQLTLRSLYYKFIAVDYFPNTIQSYKYLGGIMADARLAGYVDWYLLEDNTRYLADLQHFDSVQSALDQLAASYHTDLWAEQKIRPEVWVEKDAAVGYINACCHENDVPFFACRGYTSLSEMWRASMRLRQYIKNGQTPYIIHFGDHDPSGIDMSRDIYDRLQKTFMADIDFKRCALTMDQVRESNAPPNPAKVTDSRYAVYLEKYGEDSWELDALEPLQFRELIETHLKGIRDQEQWDRDVAEKARVKEQMQDIAGNWESIPQSRERIATLEKELTKVQKQLAATKKPIKKRKPK